MFLERVLTAASILMLMPSHDRGVSIANASTTLYSTFDPGDIYDQFSGWTIGGSRVNVQGLQFVPDVSGVVQTIEIAAFRLAGGSGVNISLRTDVGGMPGSVLETLPICCFGDAASIQLVNSALKPALTAGTTYWLVVSPIAAGDQFGWNRILHPPFLLNAQQSMGGPWVLGLDYRGTMRINGDVVTATKGTTWGQLKNLYR